MKIRVTNYFDVLGNKKEGYEVNNWNITEHKVRKDMKVDSSTVIKILKKIRLYSIKCE